MHCCVLLSEQNFLTLDGAQLIFLIYNTPRYALKELQEVEEGFIEGGVEIIEAVAEIVEHPKSSLNAIEVAIENPVHSLVQIEKEVEEVCKGRVAHCLGKSIFITGSTVFGGSIVEGALGAGEVAFQVVEAGAHTEMYSQMANDENTS